MDWQVMPLDMLRRSLERSLGSECSPATSYGTHEGGDDLDGVTQVNVERQQQMYVRYSGMQEGTQMMDTYCLCLLLHGCESQGLRGRPHYFLS
jgi:hypothetical protein